MVNLKKGRKIPVFATGGAVLFGYNVAKDYNKGSDSDIGRMMWENFGVNYKGYAGSGVGPFKLSQFIAGTAPVWVGAAASMFASKSGLNRYVNLPYVKP